MPMNSPLADYVKSAAHLLDLPLEAAQVERVALQLTRTLAMAEVLRAFPLGPYDEPAELFHPAPFPADDPA